MTRTSSKQSGTDVIDAYRVLIVFINFMAINVLVCNEGKLRIYCNHEISVSCSLEMLCYSGRCCHVFAGASSGIGRATAILFSRLGANVMLTGRNELGLKETLKQCHASVKSYTVVGDVTSQSDVENVVNNAVGSLGKLDILVRL